MIAFTQNLDRTYFEFFKNQNDLSQFILRWLLILILAIIPMMGGCATKVDGYTATEIFGDTLEAKLASAAASGDAERVRELVKQGANPNAIGAQKITPLGWALVAKNATGVEALLSSGANANQPFGEKIVWYPIFFASMIEPDEILKALLKYGANPNQPGDDSYFVPLRAAISDIEKVRMLVEAGADVNGGAEHGYELARIATHGKNLDVVSYLIEKGYRTNLLLLAWSVKNSKDHFKPEQNIYKPKILEQLKQLGVIPPENRPPSLIEQSVNRQHSSKK